MYTKIKTEKEINALRESGAMLASVLSTIEANIEESMTTKDIANVAKRELSKLGGQPAFLGYQGFPDVICTSVNEEIVHGIPSNTKVIKSGDIVSVDFGVSYKGMISDSALSVIIGNPKSKQHSRLVNATRDSLEATFEIIKGGVKVGDIGVAVQNVLEQAGLGIVRDLVGHGVGHELHEDPNIPNYGKKNTGAVLETGMTIAVEPMATLGQESVVTSADNWTISTRDGSLSAHFEHTILITEQGCEVLTERK
jgi:methionyl aminopeptidase